MSLDSAKPGDLVAMPYERGNAEQLTVERVTAAQIITVGGARWHRHNGRLIGKTKGRIEPWTEKHAAANANHAAAERLSKASLALKQAVTGWRTPLPPNTVAADDLAASIEGYLASLETIEP